jgi:hypothetical protein
MKKIIAMAALTALFSMGVAQVRADSLASGFVLGTGIPQNIFTVTDANGLELGLAAHSRAPSPVAAEGTDNVYYALAGVKSGDALWNFDYSIDTSEGSTLDLTGLNATLKVSGPITGTLDPIAINGVLVGSPAAQSTVLAQNSENLSFGVFGATGFDPTAVGTYTFTLDVTNKATGADLATDVITVNVVNALPTPLPSAAGMGFGMLALVGSAALLRKKLSVA